MCDHLFRKSVCLKLIWLALLLLLVTATFRAQQTQSTSPVSTGSIRLRATVLDNAGRFIPGLTRDDFAVSIEKSSQQITHVSNDEPASIVMLIDMSYSMKTSNRKIVRFSDLAQVMEGFI